ncbi:MAG: hypothetical protein ABJF10_15140, partial [Chthoniobacter sp.]|uniref:hypothetical protein n=1 Tax=Chthoniobacter sp. TaxID=2510640 RepID=UPI0032ACBC73
MSLISLQTIAAVLLVSSAALRAADVPPSAPTTHGQRPTPKTPMVLKEPADWRLETMSVPPGFAPGVKLSGSEEIRFAPGMFDTTSSTYFTCALAIVAEGAPVLGAPEIKDFLERYYRGLSTGRARRNKMVVDPTQMNAEVTPVPGTKDRFDADIVFFDSFSDGRKITLHVEAQVIPQPATNRTCLILLVSPSARESDVWPPLR